MKSREELQEEWIEAASACLIVDFGLASGMAAAAAKALLNRELMVAAHPRTPTEVVYEHMESDEPPVVDPDGDYGDEAVATCSFGMTRL